MIGKKINELATELAPVSTDLTIIGDPISGVSKKITIAQLGAIFSGAVSFYDNLASFPAIGDINVIYCAKDTKKLYLWGGSSYVEVFPSQALLDTYQLRSEKGVSNGYASLDSGGKVPISQLPSSIMEYKGTWNAATNTPTLANGTGDTGDVYICNVAGSVNFGAGSITFAVGDYVIYSGSIWQRSSGAVGTVTSVGVSVNGDAISVSNSPISTSGTIALAFAGTSSQYINGAGNLTNFPTSLVSGSGTIYSLTKWGFTTGTIINSNLYDTGTTIYNNNPTSGSFAVQFNGNTTSGQSYGLLINAGSDANDIALRIQNVSSTSEYFFVYGDGKVKMNNIPNATTDTDVFLVSDGGFIKYRTGAQLLSDIGAASATGYVPYTGATGNVDLGTYDLTADIINTNDIKAISSAGLDIYSNSGTHIALLGAGGGSGVTLYGGLIGTSATFTTSGSSDTFAINHSSGSGVAASITKGGAGEALTVVKTSGSGNAASITGGVTLLDELHLTTDLADSYIASAATWNAKQNAITLTTTGTSGAATLVGATLNIPQYADQFVGTVTSVGLSSATSGVTIGSTPITTSGTITLAIATASGSQQGLLSSTDWTTFNNKQNALTNPVTGTGTTNYLPKFTGASTIGNSLLIDQGSYVESTANMLISNATTYRGLSITTTTASARPTLSFVNSNYAQYGSYIQDINGRLDFGRMNYDFGGHSPYMTLDTSGNLGLGVTPSAWSGGNVGLDIGGDPFSGINASLRLSITTNAYAIGATHYYRSSGLSSQQYRLSVGTGNHEWYTAPSGTAGNAISFTQAMTLNASGQLLVGTTSAQSGTKLQVAGVLDVWSSTNTLLRLYHDGTRGVIETFTGGAYSVTAINPSGGNLLVGTSTDAGYKLDVSGTGIFRNVLNVRYDGGTSVDAALRLRGTNATARTTRLQFEDYNGSIADGLIEFKIPTAGSGTGSYLSLGVNSPAMYIVNGGNVGIGTTSPQAKLDVITSGYSYAASPLKGTGMNLVGAAGSGVGGGDGAASGVLNVIDNAAMGINNGGTITLGGNYIGSGNAYSLTYAGIKGGKENGTDYNSAGYLALYTTPSGASPLERMRITSGGNVGIGTTNPNAPLDVTSTTSGSSNIQQWSYNSSPSSYRLQLNTIVSSGLVKYSFDMLNAGSTYNNVLVLDRGNVGIGTTSPSVKLEVAGAIKTGNPGLGSAGAIKLGQVFGGTAFGVGGYIPIDIDGTTYYINLATTTP